MQLRDLLKLFQKFMHTHEDTTDIRWSDGGGSAKRAVLNRVIGGVGKETRVTTSPSTCPARIVSKSGAFYLVDLYADGIDQVATERNVKCYVLELNYAETLPAGTWIIATLSAIGETGAGMV